MTKQTKLLLGLAAVGVAGYFIYKAQTKKAFANLLDGGSLCTECFDPQQAQWRCKEPKTTTQAGCGKNVVGQQMLKCCDFSFRF